MAKPKTKTAPRKVDADFFGLSKDATAGVEIDVGAITPNPNQPRKTFGQKELRELASSIDKHGLLQDVVVVKDAEGDGYTLVAGERRWRAHQLLKRKTITAKLIAATNIDELAVIENLQREDLHPLEEAAGLAMLMESHSYTQKTLGGVVGKAQATISELLRLNSLPDAIKDDYRTSDIPRSVVLEIAKEKNEKEQRKLWRKAKAGLTVRTARKDRGKRADAPDPAKVAVRVGKRFVSALIDLPDNTAAEVLKELAALVTRAETALPEDAFETDKT